MDIDLTQRLRQSSASYPRKFGRYHPSELYFINKGDVTPEEWLNPKEKDMKTILKMWSGTGMHNQLEELLGSNSSEKKGEIVYKDIVLAGRADFFPPGLPHQVWEFKTSDKKMKEAKPWHEHQVKLYCSMFGKAQGLVYQPVQDANGLYLKCLKVVDRDDVWFEAELEKLYQFHLKVKELWKQ